MGRCWDVEKGPTTALFEQPQHPYTRATVSAIPVAGPEAPRPHISLDPTPFSRRAISDVSTGD